MERIDEQLLLNADKLLFAADLVDYIIIKTRPSFANKTASILGRVDHLRNFTYNRFNKTIRKALSIIDINQDRSVYGDFQAMMQENTVNKESFKAYGNNYRKCNVPESFHSKSFLMYCDRIANMAGYFLSYGIDDAPEVAVELILDAFPPHIMYHRAWDKLTKVAMTLEVLGNDYFGDDMSSDSDSEQDYVSSCENDGDSENLVNMDVSVSSPEDLQHRNIDIDSSIREKASGNMNGGNNASILNVKSISLPRTEVVKAMDFQSSDSTSSSVLSSFKFSSNDESPEKDVPNNGS